MLKLICGPSGSGKSAMLTEFIRHDIKEKRRCYLLVPEQQAYISERDLPRVLPPNAGLYFEIVNFSRLAETVFREYGGITHTSTSQGLRTLLMWDTLRTLSPILSKYGNGTSNLALTQMMLHTVNELRADGVTCEILEKAKSELPADTPLAEKLSDIAAIDSAFHARVEEAFGSDRSDDLFRMATLLEEHSFFKDCHIYIDSFTDFTAQEYAVLRQLMRQANSVTVTLLCDDFASSLPHFKAVRETARRLSHLADRTGCPVERLTLTINNSTKPQVLSLLERDLWRFDAARSQEISTETNDTIHLVRAANLYEESEAVALNILELIGKGMHYGDIAVSVRDAENYRGILDAALERYEIPYFFSERVDLCTKPLARLLLSALRAVSRGYRVQDIMTLVKTGLVGVNIAESSMFEEYCNTWHISGKRFLEPVWSMNPDGLVTARSARAEEILAAANHTKDIVIQPLVRLYSAMRLSSRVPDRCRAVYEYLQELHLDDTLTERAATELREGRGRDANETLRLYDILTHALISLATVFPDTEVTVDEFLSMLTILFSESDLGSVPNLHDCVVVGSASTMRVENIRAMVVAGLCEGEFPQAVSDEGILTDSDKENLEGVGVILGSRTPLRNAQELLFVYRTFTKPREYLRLFTVAHKTDGSALTPSLAFNRVKFLFDLPIEEFDSGEVRRAIGLPEFTKTNETTLYNIPMPNGTDLRLSQTRLQAFMLCPYRYYCTYSLGLREQKDSRPSYADDGLFLHYVFEHFLKNAHREDGRLIVPPYEALAHIADDILASYLAEVCPIPIQEMDKRLLHLFTRLRQLALMMLQDIIAELHNSLFVPSAFEQIIGSPEGLPAVVLELNDGSRVTLSGIIDRIDLYETNGKTYVRVIDYKSGVHKFAPEDVRTGLDIQLILYLYAATASTPDKMKAGGAMYLYAETQKGIVTVGRSGICSDDPTVENALDTSEERSYTKKLIRASEEELASLMEDMTTATKDAAARILSGEVQKTPSERACSFCPVAKHCDKAYRK